MTNPQDIARMLELVSKEQLSVAIYVDYLGYGPTATIDFAVRLRKGDFLRPQIEVTGRSRKSLDEAFEGALSELYAAGELSARLEPASHCNESERDIGIPV